MKKLFFILFFLSIALPVFSQNDSLEAVFEENSSKIDSLNLIIKDIVITGNNVTQDDIILREMTLKKGGRFTLKKYRGDILNIYNLALFTKVEIIPIPINEKEVTLNVDVKERWYILPLPSGGIEDGEWRKVWIGLNLRWDNFRGRDENLNFGFRAFYNPSVSLKYSVPWIGKKLHLFMTIGGAWQRSKNQSLEAVGKESGSNTIKYSDNNYENIQYKGELTLGKYLTKNFAVYTEYRFNHLRVTEYQPGRTLSTNGLDRYLSFGLGISYDTRNIREYATKGVFLRTFFYRYGFLDKEINFGRFTLDNHSFIPVRFSDYYYITLATKIQTSLAVGAVIPVYNHEYLGYSEDYVRGWKGKAFEGDNLLTAYNEIRIPIITPRYVKGKQMPVVKDIPIIKNLDIRYGLYFTLIYDVGAVWYKNENIFKQRFISGTGIGINIIAPFGYVLRADWVFRIAKPTVGQLGLSLSAKF